MMNKRAYKNMLAVAVVAALSGTTDGLRMKRVQQLRRIQLPQLQR